MENLSPRELLEQLAHPGSPSFTLLDVRSEAEFAKGSLPGATNIPILNDSHRHQVGLTYKQIGKNAAIDLGHQLVDPLRGTLASCWSKAIEVHQSKRVVVFCWRGGMRSRFVCEALKEMGYDPVQVQGGFKAIRREVLARFTQTPKLIVVSGMTGSRKTTLIQALGKRAIDLEAMARHRGSAFGGDVDQQPSQIQFENQLALALLVGRGPLVVEDESRNIGRCRVPEPLYESMSKAPYVFVDESVPNRALHIALEYGLAETQSGVSIEALKGHFLDCLEKISRRLGGLRTEQVRKKLLDAFGASSFEPTRHQAWIAQLLTDYYDQQYLYAFDRKPDRTCLFRGSWEHCLRFLQSHQEPSEPKPKKLPTDKVPTPRPAGIAADSLLCGALN